MKKPKDEIISIIRSLLIAVGAFFAGKTFLGQAVTDEVWAGWVGALISVVGLIWGFTEKTVTIEAFTSTFKNLLVVVGAILVSKGLLTAEMFITLSGLATVIIPIVYGWLNKKKSQSIAAGTTAIADLSGVNENKPYLISPRVEKKKAA